MLFHMSPTKLPLVEHQVMLSSVYSSYRKMFLVENICRDIITYFPMFGCGVKNANTHDLWFLNMEYMTDMKI